jgi:hypothetical protein
MPETTRRTARVRRQPGIVPSPRPPADDQPSLAAWRDDGLGTYPVVRYAVAHEPGPHVPG